jgi:hypothetical protein
MSVSYLWVTGFRSFKGATETCRTGLHLWQKRTGIGNFWSRVHGIEHTLLGFSWLYQVRRIREAWNYRLWYRNREMNVTVKLTVKFYVESEVYIQLSIHRIQMKLGLLLTRSLFLPFPIMLPSFGYDRPNHISIFSVHQFLPELS